MVNMNPNYVFSGTLIAASGYLVRLIASLGNLVWDSLAYVWDFIPYLSILLYLLGIITALYGIFGGRKWIESKTIANISIFTALSVALVLSPVKFPAPYAPFLKYKIWEIPIVAAFLLFGPLVGVATSVINTIILLVVYPGDLPTGPLYNLAAVLSMLLGIYIIHRLATEYFSKRQETNLSRLQETIVTSFSTALGSIARVGIMSIVNWAFLRYPYPVGFSMPVEALTAILPTIGLFNATLALYTIPLGYFVSRAVSFGTSTARWTQR